jgi:hypothetical protein
VPVSTATAASFASSSIPYPARGGHGAELPLDQAEKLGGRALASSI